MKSDTMKQPDNTDKLYWGNKKCDAAILLLCFLPLCVWAEQK